MNPAEHIFEELRCAVEGVVYASLDAKVDAVTRELRRLDANPNLVRSLAGWHWINEALEQPPLDYAA